jgi:hypothetical protein
MTVPYTFANATGNIALNELDINFAYVANNVATANSALYANSVTGNYQPYITTVGTLENLSVAGTATANYFVGDGNQLTNLTGSNIISSSWANANISTTGNITAGYLLGNGSQLTGLPSGYSNANVAAYLPTYTGNIGAGNVLSAHTVSAFGNIYTSGFFVGTFVGNVTGNLVVPGANTQVLYNNSGNAGASAGLTFNSASNVLAVAGNVVANNFVGNISTTVINVSSNVSAGNVNASTTIFSAGNISGGNIAATANVTGGNINSIGILSANSLAVAGNISGGNIFSGGQISIVGSITAGNATVANLTANGNIYTTANIHAGYFTGNGSQLSNISAVNVTGTVAYANYANTANSSTYSGTVITNAQPNITSVGTLTSLSVTGNVISNGNIAMVSNLPRNVWVANVAPTSGQGNVGDIWYQTP